MLSAALLAIIANTDRSDGCWLWTRSVLTSGYAQMNRAGFRHARVHRVAYELAYGPIPDGLVIDHLCRVKRCVNPAHLEAVTQRENLLRGETFNAANAAKTHCPKGHPLSGANLYMDPKRGHRRCRSCGNTSARRRTAERRLRKKQVAA